MKNPWKMTIAQAEAKGLPASVTGFARELARKTANVVFIQKTDNQYVLMNDINATLHCIDK